jgi:SAM-dependent methyltransferase
VRRETKKSPTNLDPHTAEGFDRIWKRYGAPEAHGGSLEQSDAFEAYFSIFPMERLAGAEGFDLGCGNGRIARYVAPVAGRLHCIDQSEAGLAAAKAAMRHLSNVDFHQASVDSLPLADGSQDFGYSIGVLHHIPDPIAGLRNCVAKLKSGAPFLLYLYYSLDNRPRWFRVVWRAADVARRIISRLPFRLRAAASTAIAAVAYWPLSRAGRLLRSLGVPTANLPLSIYVDQSWATLKADSLDRFGTSVEHRFSRAQIEEMMRDVGLVDIRFREEQPYWVALGYRQ